MKALAQLLHPKLAWTSTLYQAGQTDRQTDGRTDGRTDGQAQPYIPSFSRGITRNFRGDSDLSFFFLDAKCLQDFHEMTRPALTITSDL